MPSYKIGAVLVGSAANPCCCEPPIDCCLYPWPDPLVTPLYPPEDLPATVLLVSDGENEWNFLFTHVEGEYYYVTASDPFIRLTATFVGDFGPSPFWRVAEYVGGEPTGIVFGVEMPCLISDSSYITEDEFPDTLYGACDVFVPGDTVVLNRTSLCIWEGTSVLVGSFVRIGYALPEGSEPYKWEGLWEGNLCVKTDPQSSPMGDYEQTPSVTFFTVSDTP